MFSTHLSLSLAPSFFFVSQMATNYTTLNINIHTLECVVLLGNLHYGTETVTDNTLKSFFFTSSRKRKEKLFSVTVSRSTWKIKSASHVSSYEFPSVFLYLQFTVLMLKAQQNTRFGNEPAKRHIIMMSGTSRSGEWRIECSCTTL